MPEPSLKTRTARAVKWNAIDRLVCQALYAVTGIVLANLLSPDDFGLAGAVLIFQAFAAILVDSGFSYALLQKKDPTRIDYSSVLWFNLAVAALLYGILYACAPGIADIFGHDERLIDLSRVMFATIILNASAIVQVNHLTKQMRIKPIVVADAISLCLGGAIGIVLALQGAGAWAIVWQAITNSGVKSLVLWISTRWMPMAEISWQSLRSFLPVGGGMMLTSFLNTLFQNIYAFFIGNRAGMASLGYYTQSDKWSKMGITSVTQTLTSSFVPPLSAAQDDPVRFRRLCHKMNKMTAYMSFPAMLWLIAMAGPIFHTLFGDKWDFSIPLFQLLLVRGLFMIFSGLYNNYLLALGFSKAIFWLEALRDVLALIALAGAFPYLALGKGDNLVWGIEVMLYGQIGAVAIAWGATLAVTVKKVGSSAKNFLLDLAPYLLFGGLITIGIAMMNFLAIPAWALLLAQAATAIALYVGINYLLRSRIQQDIFEFFKLKSAKSEEGLGVMG